MNMVQLSRREQEIVEHLLNGEGYHVIGKQVGLATETVKRHVGNIFQKTGLNSRFKIAAYFYHKRLKEAMFQRSAALNARKKLAPPQIT